MLNSSSCYVGIDNTQHSFDHGQTAGMYVRGENEAGDNMLWGDLGSDDNGATSRRAVDQAGTVCTLRKALSKRIGQAVLNG